MKYEKHLSKLRNIVLQLQGQSLKSVLLRAAAYRADEIAGHLHSPEEIFSEFRTNIYKHVNELSQQACFNIVSDAECLKELKDELIEKLAKVFEFEETMYILLDGLSKEDRDLIEPLLKNQYNYNKECAENSYSAADIGGLRRIMLPMVRRIYKDMPLRNLIGIQPLQGPVGNVFYLRYRAFDVETKEQIDLPSLSFDSKFSGGRKITLDIVSDAVEARSRKLQASWTLEAVQDLKSYHGLDIEAEMVQALSSEVRCEITNEAINDVKRLAGEPEILKLDGDESLQLAKLGISINRMANEIARLTRRGAGNWVVVSSNMANLLSKTSSFAEPELQKFQMSGDLMDVGTINGCMKIYSMINFPDDEILVGYKGKNGECDTGYVLSPYVPLMSTGVVVHPKTFQPLVTFMTRYAKSVNGADEKNSVASNHYKLLKIESDLLIPKEDEKKE